MLLWLFCFVDGVKPKPLKRVPVLIAFGVIALVCLLRYWEPDFIERLERMTFDLRARAALRFPTPAANNLGFVFIDEESAKRVALDSSLGYHFGLLWPRQVYGRLIHELSAQHARAVAFDIFFPDLRPDHPPVLMADGTTMESDAFFALQMRLASNVVLAISPDMAPPDLFFTNAVAVGDASADRDSDGVLRRAKAFRIYRRWHPAFRQLEQDPDYAVDLRQARVTRHAIVLPRAAELGDITIALDAQGNFDVADLAGEKLPAGMAAKAKPFTEVRVWHMGVWLAAIELQLDLSSANIDLAHGKITLPGHGGLRRIIPVDHEGYFFINWELPTNSRQLTREPFYALLAQDKLRLAGRTNELSSPWRGKLAVIGSSALLGNNLTDRGATAISEDTLLVSKHWNVANSIITDRFIHRSPLAIDFALITLLGITAALLTWRLRGVFASVAVALVIGGYVALAVRLYIDTRYWLPLVLPVFGACVMIYVCLLTWRVVFEQAERRRTRAVLSTIVSPKIANVLLQAEKLTLQGARREVTVLFADVRDFTEFTDASQERVAEFVRQNGLEGSAAESCFDDQARETLATINQYLGVVADIVLEHDGVWDKFIGDCVMAFWGAPNPDRRHALACVRAAIAAQRAIDDLNRQRAEENEKRRLENQARVAAGLAPRPMLAVLYLGTGINSGMVTVGLMGSEIKGVARQGNYTVFGREVNLASRLEGASGRGRVFISQSTYQHLQRDDPALASTCIRLDKPITLKGFRQPVAVYEVPWGSRQVSFPEAQPPGAASDTNSIPLCQGSNPG